MPGTEEPPMTHPDRFDARRTQMLHELQSDLCNLVESGDLTDMEANEWFNMKADQWAQEG